MGLKKIFEEHREMRKNAKARAKLEGQPKPDDAQEVSPADIENQRQPPKGKRRKAKRKAGKKGDQDAQNDPKSANSCNTALITFLIVGIVAGGVVGLICWAPWKYNRHYFRVTFPPNTPFGFTVKEDEEKVGRRDGRKLVVDWVDRKSIAWKTGVRSGQHVEQIGSLKLAKLSLDEINAFLKAGAQNDSVDVKFSGSPARDDSGRTSNADDANVNVGAPTTPDTECRDVNPNSEITMSWDIDAMNQNPESDDKHRFHGMASGDPHLFTQFYHGSDQASDFPQVRAKGPLVFKPVPLGEYGKYYMGDKRLERHFRGMGTIYKSEKAILFYSPADRDWKAMYCDFDDPTKFTVKQMKFLRSDTTSNSQKIPSNGSWTRDASHINDFNDTFGTIKKYEKNDWNWLTFKIEVTEP